MQRLAPVLDELMRLPTSISRRQRAHYAAELDELTDLLTAMLTLAVMRKTGSLPALRNATNLTTTAVCVAARPTVTLPSSLRFDGRFVERTLKIWDRYTSRDPELASTYLRVMKGEYVVGIAGRDLVDAIAADEVDDLERELAGAERVTGLCHDCS